MDDEEMKLSTQVAVMNSRFTDFLERYDNHEDERKIRISKLFDKIGVVQKCVDRLPCGIHEERMNGINKGLKVMTGLVVILMSAVVGGAIKMVLGG